MKEKFGAYARYGLAALGLIGLVGAAYWLGLPDHEAPARQKQSQSAEDASKSNAALVKPAFDLVRISRGGTGVIAGRMAPGALVELYANGEKLSTVTADANGEWVIILDQPLEAGSIELNLRAHAGADTSEGDDVVVVSVPERGGEKFVEAREAGVVAVLSPKSGEGVSRILQKPGGNGFLEIGDSLHLNSVDYGNGNMIFAGTALPRVELRVYLDDVFQDIVKVSDEGAWQMSRTGDLEAGTHRLRLDQTLSGGDVQLRIEQPFEANMPVDFTQEKGGVLVKPGNSLWHIARRLYGTGVRYTLIFQENSEKIVDPNLIYPGQIFKLPSRQENKP